MSIITSRYPQARLRRNRKSQFIRDMVQEHNINVKDIIYPVFIVEGDERIDPILSMPGQNRVSLDNLLSIARDCCVLGISGIAIFPVIESDKTIDTIHESYNANGLVQRAVRLLKTNYPQLGVFTDVALDPYTVNGHDGITDEDGYVINDITNYFLVKQAVSHAQAGADFVCPSDMMDGRIGLIRSELEKQKYCNTGIVSYAAKYASTFYGPFRDAVKASTKLGKHGKTTYQLNVANINEALYEVALDIDEGCDIVMIKPGLSYLDVVARVKSEFKKPTAVYSVSGEYAMLKAVAVNGYLEYDKALIEMMLSFKRAGADIIWTYAALEIARLLNK